MKLIIDRKIFYVKKKKLLKLFAVLKKLGMLVKTNVWKYYW